MKILLTLILALGIWLRLYHLDWSPPGLYADETSIIYNAYSILKTGKDEFGVAWPLFFRAFGEYKNPVFIYSLIPLIKIFGLEPITVRVGAALWGSWALALMYIFAKQVSKNKTVALLATLILSLMPWQLHYSRIGFEAISFSTLFLASWTVYLWWRESKQPMVAIAWGTLLGLTWYSYTTARLWMVLLWVLTVIVDRQLFKKYKPALILSGLAFGIMLLPLIPWQQKYPGSLTARFNQISIFNDRPGLKLIIERVGKTYWGHWQPQWLFNRGDTTLRHSSGVSSEMLASWSLFFIAGLIFSLIKFRKKPVWRLILLMIGLFPLAATLTQTSPIATRTIQAVPFFSLIIAEGVFIWRKKFILLIFLLLTGLEFSNYYYKLLTEYPKTVWLPRHGFDANLGPAIKAAGKDFCMSSNVDQGYIQGLFFTQSDPELWQTKHQADFKIVKAETAKTECLGKNFIGTENECLQPEGKLLAQFGADYCLILKN